VGLKLAWPLLGFIGFQKSRKFLATESGLFLSSGIHKWMNLELMRVIFLTLLKGSGFRVVYYTSTSNFVESMENETRTPHP
jgi:hypothetical protein